MTWLLLWLPLILLTWLLLWLPLILLAVYPAAIQFERGGWWRLLFWLYYPAAVLDVLLNYTVLALYTWDFPRAGEYTFSRRLSRLLLRSDWRRWFAVVLKSFLDYFDPKGIHVL